jgi:hypothetical protein
MLFFHFSYLYVRCVPLIGQGMAPAAMKAYWASQAFKVNLVELDAAVAADADRRKAGKPATPWKFPMAKAFPVQKVVMTPKKQAFCTTLLKGVKKNYAAHFKSCIMDGDFPELSRAIVKTVKRVAKQKKVAKTQLKKVVRRTQRLAATCGLKVRVIMIVFIYIFYQSISMDA